MNLLKKYLDKTPKPHTGTIAYLAALDHVAETAPQVSQSILNELNAERSHLKLIASENFSSLAVQLAMGNLMTDKYAEGYPEHRFYAGCENVDAVEKLAVAELKSLFGCDHAYVQPHSGADANLVSIWAILLQRVQTPEIEKLGKSVDELSPEEYEKVRQLLVNQKLMGMSLNSGGHLTHGYRHNVSSKMMRSVGYDVDRNTGLLDYKMIAEQAKKEKPLILLAGYSAYPRRINFAKMREIADSVGAVLWADIAHFAGLMAGKVFAGEENPVPYAHIISSTTHKTLRGPRGGFIMCKQEFADAVNKGCPMVLGGPLPHVMAAKAVAFKEANTPAFAAYAQQVVANASQLAEALKANGLKLLTGGTDNHLVMIDISDLPITGRQAELALREAMITVNRNAIPFDKNGPWYTSGIRIGSAAMTTLGMGSGQMKEIASIIADVLKNSTSQMVEKTGKPSKAHCTTDEKVLERSKSRVKSLLDQFPLYPEIDLKNV
jgi:glycine hydroxymethyltransferase